MSQQPNHRGGYNGSYRTGYPSQGRQQHYAQGQQNYGQQFQGYPFAQPNHYQQFMQPAQMFAPQFTGQGMPHNVQHMTQAQHQHQHQHQPQMPPQLVATPATQPSAKESKAAETPAKPKKKNTLWDDEDEDDGDSKKSSPSSPAAETTSEKEAQDTAQTASDAASNTVADKDQHEEPVAEKPKAPKTLFDDADDAADDEKKPAETGNDTSSDAVPPAKKVAEESSSDAATVTKPKARANLFSEGTDAAEGDEGEYDDDGDEDDAEEVFDEDEEDEDDEDEEEDVLLEDATPTYPSNCWTPTTPNLPKVYPIQFLLEFKKCPADFDLEKEKKLSPNPHTLENLHIKSKDFATIASTMSQKRFQSGGGNKQRRHSNRSGGSSVVGFKTRKGSNRGGSRSSGGSRSVVIPKVIKRADVKKLEATEGGYKRNQQGKIGKLRALLGKLSRDNFSDIGVQIIEGLHKYQEDLKAKAAEKDAATEESNADSVDGAKDALTKFTILVHETAMDSEFFASTYSDLARLLFRSENVPQLKDILIEQCITWYKKELKPRRLRAEELEKKRKALLQEVDEKGNPKTLPEEEENELYKLQRTRQKILANAHFIAELFKSKAVKDTALIEDCFRHYMPEGGTPGGAIESDAVLCVCKMVEAAGQQLEKKHAALLNTMFAELEKYASRKDCVKKVKFHILDLKDLRSANWTDPKKDDKGSKDANAKGNNARGNSSSNASNSSSSGNTGRRVIGNKGSGAPRRQESETFENVGLSKHKMGIFKLSGKSQSSRPFGRKQKTKEESRNTANAFAALSPASEDEDDAEQTSSPTTATTPSKEPAFDEAAVKRRATSAVGEYLMNGVFDDFKLDVEDFSKENTLRFLFEVAANKFVNSTKSAEITRLMGGLARIFKEKLATGEDFVAGLKPIFDDYDDMKMDLPKLPAALGQLLALGLVHGAVEPKFFSTETFFGLDLGCLDVFIGVLAGLPGVYGDEAKEAAVEHQKALMAAVNYSKLPRGRIPTLEDKFERAGLKDLLA